jgi:hypothetical protein
MDKEFNARWSVGEGRRNKGGRKELRGDGLFILQEGRKDFGRAWALTEWNLQCTGGLLEVLGLEG